MSCYIYIWNKLLSTPACLFVIDGTEIRSNEGTTQRHTVAMTIYTLGMTPLMMM